MIQTHQQLKNISEEYNSLFSKNEFYPLQKAWTTPHFLVFSLRFPGKTINLYIGRGNQYKGFYLSEKAPPSFLRVQDKLLDYVRKYLVGCRLGKCEVDEKLQAFLFYYKTDHSDNSFLFGYKDRQLFFIRQSHDEIYSSWNGEVSLGKVLIDLLDSLQSDKGVSAGRLFSIDDYLKDEIVKNGGKPLQKKKEKFIDRKLNNIKKDLEEVSKWSLIETDLMSEKINLDLDELQIHGQKIKFHGVASPWQKRDLVFKKIKKLKRAEEILTERLKVTNEEFENVKSGHFEVEVTKEKVIQPLWATGTKSKNTNSQFNIKEFKLKALSGVISFDAASNDYVRSQAHKDHYWFHIENYPGSHCIIKTDDFSQLSLDDLAAIASILRDSSKLMITEIPVVYSQIKNIKGIKGSKGEVIIKKPKYLRCLYGNWKEIITLL